MKYLIRAISIKNYKFIYQDDNFIENYEKRLRQIRKDEAQRPKTQEELAKIAQEKAEKPIKDAQEVQKIIKKYDLLKVNKELWKYRYDVSLNKESIKKMIIDINKQINPDFSWNIEDINLDWDINWVLSIDDSKTYFEFSWNVLTNEQKVPVIVKYLLDKFYIDLPILTIDLDKEWNKFKWYLLIKSTNIKTNISWILTSDKFVLNILYNENPVNVKLDFDYEAKSIWKTNVKIPKDAISYDKMMNLLFWWINNNMLKDENK